MKKLNHYLTCLVCLCGLAYQPLAFGNTYAFNPQVQMVGQSRQVLSRFDDTLYSVALTHKLGAEAVAKANPDLHALLPGEGETLHLPIQTILPAGKRRGIVINLPEMRLYYYAPDGNSVSVYPVGIGRQGWETPLMSSRVSSIVKDPVWTPPESIHREYESVGLSLPSVVPAGPDNPLGNFAIRIGQTSYLIHGTNKPAGVGLRVSHGCIRLYPEHIAELTQGLHIGTEVSIVNQPLKFGRHNGRLFVQGHPPVPGAAYDKTKSLAAFMAQAESMLNASELNSLKRTMRDSLLNGDLYSGVPLPVWLPEQSSQQGG